MKRISCLVLKMTMAVLFTGFAAELFAQKYPERKLIRSGNKNYDRGDHDAAELDYLKAIHANPGSYEAVYNLFNNYYMQGRYEDAEKGFDELSGNMIFLDEKELSELYYNKGNSLFRQEKYPEALEAFRHAMRYDPNDTEAKFNYAYTKKLLEDNNNDGEGESENKNDDNGDSDGEGENRQDPESGDPEGDNNSNKNNEPRQDGQNNISQEDAERMLDAIQNSEDNTRDRIDVEQIPASAASGRNW